MRKFFQKTLASVLTLGLIFVNSTFVRAENAYSPLTEVKLVGTTEPTKIVQPEYTVKQTQVRESALAALRALRGRMWDENPVVIFPEWGKLGPNGSLQFEKGKLQDLAAEYGAMTKEEYVDLIQWDNELEKIAVQRAIESNVHKKIAHIRADGSEIYTAQTQSGVVMNGEIIAWGSDISAAISRLWVDQEYDLLKGKGPDVEATAENYGASGHFLSLLDPGNNAYGFADIAGVQLGVQSIKFPKHGSDGWKKDGTFTFPVAVLASDYKEEVTTTKESIPFQSVQVGTDPATYVGDKKITKAGVTGERTLTTTTQMAFGKQVAVEKTEAVTRQPQNEEYLAGSKPVTEVKTVTHTEPVPAKSKTVQDPNQYTDYKVLTTQGIPGVKAITEEVTYTKGVESKRVVLTEKITQPAVDEVYTVGTKPITETKSSDKFEVIPFTTENIADPNQYTDFTQTIPGQEGQKKITETVTFTKGIETDRKVTETIVKPAVNEKITTGTKPIVEIKEEVQRKAVPFKTVTLEDPNQYRDYRVVTTKGVEGVVARLEQVTYTKGVETARKTIAVNTTESVDEVITVGTKVRPMQKKAPYLITGVDAPVSQAQDLRFEIASEFSGFTKVYVDKTQLTSDQFTAQSGSTIITLKKDFVASLTKGAHTLTADFKETDTFTAGQVEAVFEYAPSTAQEAQKETGKTTTAQNKAGTKVTKQENKTEDVAKTGESGQVWILIGALALLAAAIILIILRRKAKDEK